VELFDFTNSEFSKVTIGARYDNPTGGGGFNPSQRSAPNIIFDYTVNQNYPIFRSYIIDIKDAVEEIKNAINDGFELPADFPLTVYDAISGKRDFLDHLSDELNKNASWANKYEKLQTALGNLVSNTQVTLDLQIASATLKAIDNAYITVTFNNGESIRVLVKTAIINSNEIEIDPIDTRLPRDKDGNLIPQSVNSITGHTIYVSSESEASYRRYLSHFGYSLNASNSPTCRLVTTNSGAGDILQVSCW
jgi:hypothetical protein